MGAVQEICDRTALATGEGLGELVARRWRSGTARLVIGVLMVALIVANALNIAADLVAVGSGMTLLHAGPTWLWALLAGAAVTALVMVGAARRLAGHDNQPIPVLLAVRPPRRRPTRRADRWTPRGAAG
jgi:Mn2+/Fe2+ NRAMP family transporter